MHRPHAQPADTPGLLQRPRSTSTPSPTAAPPSLCVAPRRQPLPPAMLVARPGSPSTLARRWPPAAPSLPSCAQLFADFRARPRTSDPTALAIRPCFAPASAPMTLTPTASPAPTCCATPPPGPCSRLPAPPAPSRLRQPHLHRPRPRLDVRRRPSRPPALSEVETLDSVSRHRARSTAPRLSRPAPARSALQRPAGLVPFDHAQRPQWHPAPLQHRRSAWLRSAAQQLAWLCSILVRLA